MSIWIIGGKRQVFVYLRIFFRQSLPKRSLFWDRLTTLLLITALPRAQDQGSAAAASWVTSNPLGGKPKDCSAVSLLLQPKAKPLFIVSYRFLSLLTWTGIQENVPNTSGCRGTRDVYGKTSAEEGNKPPGCSQYQLFSLAIKLAAHTNSSTSLMKVRRLAGRDEVRTKKQSTGGIQNLGQRTFRGQGGIWLWISRHVGDVTCMNTWDW